FFFFFQAEDGIRDFHVTGVQTCALPISPEGGFGLQEKFIELGDRVVGILNGIDATAWNPATDPHITANYSIDDLAGKRRSKAAQIGRASCRERVENAVGTGALERIMTVL